MFLHFCVVFLVGGWKLRDDKWKRCEYGSLLGCETYFMLMVGVGVGTHQDEWQAVVAKI